MVDKLRKKISSTRGFTLVELLIVIAIIAILTVAFLPTLRGGTSKARDASKKALVGDIATVFETMVNDGEALPPVATATHNECLTDFTQGSGQTIATKLGRVPQSFPSVAGGALCTDKKGNSAALTVDGTFVFYKKFSNTDYVLAVQMENAANANVEESGVNGSRNAAAIYGIGKASDVVIFTDQAVGKGDNNFYYYLVGKGN